MSELDEKVTLYADGPALLSLPVGEVLAQARAHVADAMRWACPDEAASPEYDVYWLLRHDERMEVSLEVDEDWVSDVDCDGVEWYQQRRAKVTVWAVDGVAGMVSRYWEDARAVVPAWVNGM